MKRIIFLLTLALLTGAPLYAEEAIDASPVIIDVRTTAEFNEDHIAQALHMPYDVIDKMIGDKVADKDQPIVLYCRSGGRAGKAKATLEALGYTHVENAGGLADMKAKLGSK